MNYFPKNEANKLKADIGQVSNQMISCSIWSMPVLCGDSVLAS